MWEKGKEEVGLWGAEQASDLDLDILSLRQDVPVETFGGH